MLHATPYNINYSGFYFSSLEQFNALFDKNSAEVEEYEIQFIDGYNPKLFAAGQITQTNLDIWFNELADISDTDEQSIQIRYLLDLGFELGTAIRRSVEVCLYLGSASDYAYELFDECYEIPDFLIHYIDYGKIANGMLINDELSEFSHDIFITNPNEF